MLHGSRVGLMNGIRGSFGSIASYMIKRSYMESHEGITITAILIGNSISNFQFLALL